MTSSFITPVLGWYGEGCCRSFSAFVLFPAISHNSGKVA